MLPPPSTPVTSSNPAAGAGAKSAGRLLLVRLSAIGDIVHTLPVAAALTEARHEVVWAVQPGGRPLLAGNPAVASCVVIPSSRPFRPGAISRAVSSLRAAQVATALDLQGLWKP